MALWCISTPNGGAKGDMQASVREGWLMQRGKERFMGYGSDRNASEKERLYESVRDFLESHTVDELLRIIADVIENT